jgi:signal transduction histidine kinase
MPDYLLRITDSFINSINIEEFSIKEQLVGKIKELDDCIRRISHRINLGMEYQTRLQEIIPDIINDMKNFTGINISYFVPDHLPECSREIMLHMSRIVQELLTNASKYANNSKIRIDLAFNRREFCSFFIEMTALDLLSWSQGNRDWIERDQGKGHLARRKSRTEFIRGKGSEMGNFSAFKIGNIKTLTI